MPARTDLPTGTVTLVGEALVVAAAILTRDGAIDAAGRATGASEAMYRAGGFEWHDLERQILDEHVFGQVVGADAARFAAARAAGEALTVHEAILCTLEALAASADDEVT
jgi:hypothetical protein